MIDLTLRFLSPTFTNSDTPLAYNGEEEYFDLFLKRDDLNLYRVKDLKIQVTKEFNGRADLISKVMLNEQNNFDVLLEFNNISNPLSVQEGIVLVNPFEEDIEVYSESYKIYEDKKIDSSVISKDNQNSNSVKDKLTLIDSNLLNVNSNNITPNIALNNEVVINNGNIVLGANTMDKKCEDKMSNTQKISERIKQAIREKFSPTL